MAAATYLPFVAKTSLLTMPPFRQHIRLARCWRHLAKPLPALQEPNGGRPEWNKPSTVQPALLLVDSSARTDMTALWIQARQLETVGWATSGRVVWERWWEGSTQRFLEDARYKHLPFELFQDYGWLFPSCLTFPESSCLCAGSCREPVPRMSPSILQMSVSFWTAGCTPSV